MNFNHPSSVTVDYGGRVRNILLQCLSMNFNQNQLEIINNITGAYLISAPVGTGKA